jgi:hypothetical protein
MIVSDGYFPNLTFDNNGRNARHADDMGYLDVRAGSRLTAYTESQRK